MKMAKKEQEIDNMAPEVVMGELKSKGIPTFGTPAERKERLKKACGIKSDSPQPAQVPPQQAAPSVNQQGDPPRAGRKSNVVERIEEMKQKREERRKKIEENRKMKLEKQEENEAAGKMGDVDFEQMIEKEKLRPEEMISHISPEGLKINVCVRKRPIFKKELASSEIECVSVANPRIIVHECNCKVDGITKYVENHEFQFDNVHANI